MKSISGFSQNGIGYSLTPSIGWRGQFKNGSYLKVYVKAFIDISSSYTIYMPGLSIGKRW